MGRWERDLRHKSENGVQVSRTNTTVGCGGAFAGEVETGDAQSSLASQFSQSVRSRLSKRPCLKKYSGEKQWSKTLMCFLKTFLLILEVYVMYFDPIQPDSSFLTLPRSAPTSLTLPPIPHPLLKM